MGEGGGEREREREKARKRSSDKKRHQVDAAARKMSQYLFGFVVDVNTKKNLGDLVCCDVCLGAVI